MRRARLTIATLATCLLAGVSAVAWAAPAVSVQPDEGPAGSTTTVSGSDFPSGRPVLIRWDGSLIGQGRVEGDGSFAVGITVPSDASVGAHQVEAQAQGVSASATFTVTAPSTTTTTEATTTTTEGSTTTTAEDDRSTTTEAEGGSSGGDGDTTTTTEAGTPTEGEQTGGEEADTDPGQPTREDLVSSFTVDPTVIRPGETLRVSGELVDPGLGPLAVVVDGIDTDAEISIRSEGTFLADVVVPEGVRLGTREVALLVDGEEAALARVSVLAPRQPLSTGTVLATIGIPLLLLGLVLVVLRRRQEEPEHQEVSVASTPAEPGTAEMAPAEPPPVLLDGEAWVRVLPDLGEGAVIERIGPGLDGWWMVGHATGDGDTQLARIWSSADGRAWRTVATPAEGVAAALVEVGDDRFLLGSEFRATGVQGRVWRLEDDGGVEALADAPALQGAAFDQVAVDEDRVVVAGRNVGGRAVWVWEPSGAGWEVRSAPMVINHLLAAAGGYLAVGRLSEEHRTAVLWSPDGREWEERAPGSFAEASLDAVTRFEGGLVAVGSDLNGAVVWVSDDGTGWVRVPFEAEPGTGMELVVDAGGSLVAFGTRRPHRGRGVDLAVWRSADGVTWEPVEYEDVLRSARVVSAAWDGSRMAAAGRLSLGSAEGSADEVPALWIER